MSEIAKCPLCGNSPVIFPTFDPAEYCPEATECCGAAFTTVRAWNQYAAAMELARAYIPTHREKLDYTGPKTPSEIIERVRVACARVIEVFGGE